MQQDKDTQKIQFVFSRKAFEELEALEELTDAASKAAVVRSALRLYLWYISRRDEGYNIRLVKGKKEIEVELVV